MLKISFNSCQRLVSLVSNHNTSSTKAALRNTVLCSPPPNVILHLLPWRWEQAPMLSHLQLPRWREKIQAIPADLLTSHSHQRSAVRHWLSMLSCPTHTLKPERCTQRRTWPALLKNFSFCLHLLLQQTRFPDGSPYRNTPLQQLLDTTEVWEMLPWCWREENKSCQLCSQMTISVTWITAIPAREHY